MLIKSVKEVKPNLDIVANTRFKVVSADSRPENKVVINVGPKQMVGIIYQTGIVRDSLLQGSKEAVTLCQTYQQQK